MGEGDGEIGLAHAWEVVCVPHLHDARMKQAAMSCGETSQEQREAAG